jgi:uncharacterized protein DUF1206
MSVQTPLRAGPVKEAASTGASVERSRGFELLARAGFAARGLIYVIIGILALKLALGSGGETTDQAGALHTIARQPFGKVLLVLVAIALGGYSLWRFLHALLGHGPEKSDSTFERVAAAGSGVAYAAICVLAVQVLQGSTTSNHAPKATAGVLGWPGGTWIVAGAGVVLIGTALFQGYRGLANGFLDDSKSEQMSPTLRRVFIWLATVGHVARMVVFGLVGIFLVKAAIDYSPGTAVGLDGALAKLADRAYGPYLLGLVAAGLVAFGLYSFVDARYRKI